MESEKQSIQNPFAKSMLYIFISKILYLIQTWHHLPFPHWLRSPNLSDI